MRKVHGKADTKDESICILWDKLELPIQLHKQVLTPEFIASLRPDLFIRSEDDVCASDRIACAFMARCAKVPEGYFYGAELQGQNDCFLAPTTYEPVHCDTSKLRFPVQMKPGMHVKCKGGYSMCCSTSSSSWSQPSCDTTLWLGAWQNSLHRVTI